MINQQAILDGGEVQNRLKGRQTKRPLFCGPMVNVNLLLLVMAAALVLLVQQKVVGYAIVQSTSFNRRSLLSTTRCLNNKMSSRDILIRRNGAGENRFVVQGLRSTEIFRRRMSSRTDETNDDDDDDNNNKLNEEIKELKRQQQECIPKMISVRQPETNVVASQDGAVQEQNAPKEDDISKRFKYTVNALMGAFDPPLQGENNTERDEGNILNAMMTFPTKYTFSAVGRTNGDTELQQQYANDVKQCVLERIPDDEEDNIQITVKPRGSKFTRVDVEVTVDNPTIITKVYDAIGQLDATVMKY